MRLGEDDIQPAGAARESGWNLRGGSNDLLQPIPPRGMPTGPLSWICLCSQNRPDDMVMVVVFREMFCNVPQREAFCNVPPLPSAFPLFPTTPPVMFSKRYGMIQIRDYFLPSLAEYEAIIQQGSLSLRDLKVMNLYGTLLTKKGFLPWPSGSQWQSSIGYTYNV